MSFDVEAVRKDFPILERRVHSDAVEGGPELAATLEDSGYDKYVKLGEAA